VDRVRAPARGDDRLSATDGWHPRGDLERDDLDEDDHLDRLDDLQPAVRTRSELAAAPHLRALGHGHRVHPRLADGSWTALAGPPWGEDATLAVDGAGKAHIAYEGFRPGYATNKSGAWVRKALATYSLDYFDDSPVCIALTNTGKARVIFARSESDGSEDSLGLYLAREL
jgi:hypothetical protein